MAIFVYMPIKHNYVAGGGSAVEHLPSMHEALGSIHSIHTLSPPPYRVLFGQLDTS